MNRAMNNTVAVECQYIGLGVQCDHSAKGRTFWALIDQCDEPLEATTWRAAWQEARGVWVEWMRIEGFGVIPEKFVPRSVENCNHRTITYRDGSRKRY